MEKVVPDTNVLIAYFSDFSTTGPLLEKYIVNKKVILSIVVVCEFLVKAKVGEEKVLRQMTNFIPVQEIDWEIANAAVKLRRETLQKSKRVHLLDCFIAATAKLNNATLLTFDKRDFPLRGLRVKEV